jgi:hypothetical protein
MTVAEGAPIDPQLVTRTGVGHRATCTWLRNAPSDITAVIRSHQAFEIAAWPLPFLGSTPRPRVSE